jgi:general secretion pathway protein I
MRWRSPAGGFTLIEVLVALVIVALAAAAAMEAITGAAGNIGRLRERSFAQWLALNRIAELRTQATPPANGTNTATVEFAGARWELREDVSVFNATFGLRRIDVSARPALATTPSSATSADKDDSFTVTMSGVLGTAVAPPSGNLPDWEPAPQQSGPQQQPGAQPPPQPGGRLPVTPPPGAT